MRFKYLFLYIASVSQIQCGSIESYLRKLDHGSQLQQIKHIDFIYMINLDQRPEKWERMRNEFAPYGIELFRFPAIYGWTLPMSVIEDLGVLFVPGMYQRSPYKVNYNGMVLLDPRTTADPEIPGQYYQLGPHLYHIRCFSVSMKGGLLGTYLSDLSIYQDAYDRGYNTIWLLEDDVKIQGDPFELGAWIDRLDALVGADGWDLFYTDNVTYFKGHNDIDWIWRPDITVDYKKLITIEDLGDFLRIGGRGHAHSMIIRRSGLEKILTFIKSHGMFNPNDMELSVIPNLRLFNLKKNLVIQNEVVSDTVRKNFFE